MTLSMAGRQTFDICVIGAGSGGLSVAAGASQLGARTALIERHKMGGDCLNVGCVPSKSLLAAAKAAADVARSRRFGIFDGRGKVDFGAVNAHVKGVIAGIAPHDSAARFEGLGVSVIKGSARFLGPDEVEVGDQAIRARRFVIATGSIPAIPPIPGLEPLPYFTNETIFDNAQRPEHLLVIGAGPVGLELAQAHRRLGSGVTVLEVALPLAGADPELAAVVWEALRREDIDIRAGVTIAGIEKDGARIIVRFAANGASTIVQGSHLLIAAGRKPAIEGLGLDAAGVVYTAKGITVNARLRTSNRRIYAIGDVAGLGQFTHLAAHHAGVVLRNALFRLPARADRAPVPRVTFTDPELAEVGLNEDQARAKAGRIRILRSALAENDRARTERETDGLVKIVTAANGRILGAGIVGKNAGELIQPWILAIAQGLRISAMAALVLPYPTLGEAGKRAASGFFAPKLFNPRTRKLVRFLAHFG
jgi:pyruvate/2-oxoglutarate dehydrogenase complex dihydrolipoamide dehydrogenase (E3) component